MLIERRSIKAIDRAAYNPRVDLQPGDEEYQQLHDSIHEYGLLIPLVLNKRTNRLVGGHQRLTVLENSGVTEADFSIVDLDEIKEKQLNIALNKAQGAWDDGKVAELLDSLGDRATETGFSLPEIESLQSRIEDALDTDFLDSELGAIESTFNVTIDFPAALKDEINGWIRVNSKQPLIEAMMDAARREA